MELEPKYVTGVDIGGSHITAGLVNMLDKKVEHEMIRVRVNSKAPAEEILGIWTNTIKQLWSKYDLKQTRIGFAMPGAFDYENGICLIRGFDKYESLYEMNIKEILAERLNISAEDIRFRNDAEAFLDGEIVAGAAQGFNYVIGITLGTGLGSAVSHDGKTKDAELSIMPYKGGIIEEWVSTRGLLRAYFQLSGKSVKDVQELATLYTSDTNAEKSFEIFAKHLTWFLDKFISLEYPEVLVIGGNISQAWDLFMPGVSKELKINHQHLPKIVKAKLGEDALLIGGACCFQMQTSHAEQ